jgi:molybdenum cofactor cytidylyltransferase
MAKAGRKAILTTTTKVGTDEFDGIPVSVVTGLEEMRGAIEEKSAMRLVIGGVVPHQGKYFGLDPRLIEGVSLGVDTVMLVEGDGSRRHPLKAPKDHEPVIPANTAAVFALMGGSAIDEPIDESHCYNHEMVLSLLGRTGGRFEPPVIAALAADPAGCSKGVLPGMGFMLLINQSDLEQKRASAAEALRLARTLHGIRGALVSFQLGELYVDADD